MTSISSSRNKRRNQDQWQAIIDRFEQSSQSGKQFCLDNNIGYASFCKWRQKLARDSGSVDSTPALTPQFIELGSISHNGASDQPWHITLKLGNGVELCLSQSHVPA